VRDALRPRRRRGLEAPRVGGQRAEGRTQFEHAPGVVDGRFDLAAVAHDAGVREQSRHVALVEAHDALGIELRERTPERLALVEDRQPAQAGLKAFEAELFEQPPVVADREAPFKVVVVLVGRAGLAPLAARCAVGADVESRAIVHRAIVAPPPRRLDRHERRTPQRRRRQRAARLSSR